MNSLECFARCIVVKPEKFNQEKLKEVNLVSLRISQAIYLKDSAYYCYCAYVLRMSRYLSFLSVMLTNTGIFLRGLKLSGESR